METHGLTVIETDPKIKTITSNYIIKEPALTIYNNFFYDTLFLQSLSPKTDIILFDITFPCTDITKLVSLTKKIRPDINIIINSAWVQYDLVYKCIRAGASAYLDKFGTENYLMQTIREVADGKAHLSLPIAELLMIDISQSINNLFSGSEMNLISLIAKGYTYLEVSLAINETKENILRHIFHIYQSSWKL